MDKEKTIENYWLEIEKELKILKDTSLSNADIISDQTEKILQIDSNNKVIDHNVKLSGWLLNLINSTFGKIYQKIHSEPIKDKKNPVFKNNTLSLKSKKYSSNLNIINDIEEIKSIHMAISDELDCQNNYLDSINDTSDNISNNLENNLRLAKKIIRNK